jgi:hypothetical protein
MSLDGLIGLSPEDAIKRIMPDLKSEVGRIKYYAENPLHHLVIKKGWEQRASSDWPARYEGRVGNLVFTFAVEDWTKYDGPLPVHMKEAPRFKARVLTVAYIDVKEAELNSAVASVAPKEVLPGRLMKIPLKIAKVVANGFFEGPVDFASDPETGDWRFYQLFDRQVSSALPFVGLPSPAC